jgi:hypothetical protein
MLTLERLREVLDYDSATGVFTTIISRKGMGKEERAGCSDVRGYISITIDRKCYFAHVLAWLYVYGVWPDKGLDHIDTNRSNNAISNLREANESQNAGNTKFRRNNKLGVKGVMRSDSGYRAMISPNGKAIHLGCFKTVEEAANMYRFAALAYYGKFAKELTMVSLQKFDQVEKVS